LLDGVVGAETSVAIDISIAESLASHGPVSAAGSGNFLGNLILEISLLF